MNFDDNDDQNAIREAWYYAKERIVFDRPIGRNQDIQHPLAKCGACRSLIEGMRFSPPG